MLFNVKGYFMKITTTHSFNHYKTYYTQLSLAIMSLSGLLLSGCASVDRCPLSETQKGLGACSSIQDSYNASSNSNGDGFSVFDPNSSTSVNRQFSENSKQSKNSQPVNQYGDKGKASPLYFKASLDDTKGQYVYHQAVILKTWIAPYVNQDTQDLVDAHNVFWKAKEGGWDVPVSYQSGSANDVFTPAVLGD
jgi:hypothetical protein